METEAAKFEQSKARYLERGAAKSNARGQGPGELTAQVSPPALPFSGYRPKSGPRRRR